MSDPYYSPTEEEIADKARAWRRKFSNRFVSMNTYHDAMMRVEALEAQVQTLREAGEILLNDDTPLNVGFKAIRAALAATEPKEK